MSESKDPILEIERQCLGACLSDPVAADRVVAFLEAKDFLDPTHAKVFMAISTLALQRDNPDWVSVSGMLAGKVQASEIQGYTITVTSGAYAMLHGKMILDSSKRRRIARLATEVIGMTQSSSLSQDASDEPLEALEAGIAELRNRTPGRAPIVITDAEPDLLKRIRSGESTPRGWSTGFQDVDAALGGLRDGELIVVGARPSVGKSLFGASIAEHVSIDREEPVPVLFLSMEMSASALYRRLLFGRAAVDPDMALSGNANNEEKRKLESAHRAAAGAKWYVHAEASLSIARAHSLARHFQAKHGKPLIIVDYLQLMTAPGNNRVEMVTNISGGLKSMATDLKCPVVALAQLNRNVDRTGAPQLSDLRDCGAIEQDADVVIFLSRDTMLRDPHPMDVIVAKNRPGRTGRTQILFDTQGPKMRDLPRVEQFS